jgi:spoIIIJ-associated protein
VSPAAEQAKQHLENLLTFFGVNTTVEVSEADSSIDLSVEADISGRLIGHKGETLAALQHMINMIMRAQLPERTYIHVDIGGYRKAQLERLGVRAQELAQQVIDSGEEAMLPPLNAAERRHVHALLSDHERVVTESRGEGRDRRLVIKPRN